MGQSKDTATLTQRLTKGKKQKGGGSKKIGRNKVKCAAYKAAGRRERNKRVKLGRHIALHPEDWCAVTAGMKLGRAA